MTSHDDEHISLIRHKIERAEESIKEAELLFSNNMFRASVNRIYYSMFYSVSALALHHNYDASKYQQLIGWFNKTFIKEKILDAKYGRFFIEAFEKRSDGDYEDYVEFTNEEVSEMLRNMKEFNKVIRNLLAT